MHELVENIVAQMNERQHKVERERERESHLLRVRARCGQQVVGGKQ